MKNKVVYYEQQKKKKMKLITLKRHKQLKLWFENYYFFK